MPGGQTAALNALWLVLVVISLVSRSYIPIDETRYVTVAWNMWLRGDYLVPWLNGIAYSHKPPLLFWLMNAGWAVFGVNDWWPRLVPSFFALGSVLLTMRLARLLWPQDAQIAALAPVVLLGSALWTVFTTATMFDMMIAFFTLLGVIGIFTAWRGQALKGWSLVGLAIGGGLLAKGPTILLQILPLAMLAPWWGRAAPQPVGRWFVGLLGAVLLGAIIALAWAIPAGMHGGAVYQHAIFWGQTADRMVQSFAHRRPLWWYVPLLPVILFPWLLWLPVWRGFIRLRHQFGDTGVRLCLTWLLPTFIAFSFISGKQVHYLLPIFPAFALLAARGLPQAGNSRFDRWLVAASALAIGAALIYLPYYAKGHHVAPWISTIPAWAGVAMMLSGWVIVMVNCRQRLAEVWAISLFSAFAVALTIYIATIRSAGLAYDIRPIAARLKALQDQGVPLAHVGKYPGQYQFVGRMVNEPEVVRQDQLVDWFNVHPNGKAVVYFSSRQSLAGLKTDYQQPYLGDNVVILGRESWPPSVTVAKTPDAE
jgi:4-amino-4-deoxy-L-arabinose transferase-like glycosyltransferase